MSKNIKKDLTQYKQTKPEQLSLFELSGALEDYSNSIELYDTMPKYSFGGVKREIGKAVDSLPVFVRDFEHRGKGYRLEIAPAAIQDKKTGKTINYYPSQREELVEDALRKIATRGSAQQFDDKIGVKFTYYELQQELKKMGHGYALDEIKLAIEILGKTGMEITEKDGNKVAWNSSFFSFVGRETKEMAGKERVVVMFHPLVTKSINQGTYRLFNYDRMMKMKMPLSRWLHKRISHMFSQASANNPYEIKLSTIVRDSGMKSYKNISERARQVEKSFDELQENKMILRVEKEPVKNKNKILDVLYSLFMTEDFVADAKKANKLSNLRIEDSNSEKGFDIAALRVEIQKSIYGLSNTVINNILEKIGSTEQYDEIIASLQAAKDYIELKKDANPAAITKSAITNKWTPRNIKKDKKEEGQGDPAARQTSFFDSSILTPKNDSLEAQKILTLFPEIGANYIFSDEKVIVLGVENSMFLVEQKGETLFGICENIGINKLILFQKSNSDSYGSKIVSLFRSNNKLERRMLSENDLLRIILGS